MRRVALVILVALMPSACVSVSTFQVPEPVDPGRFVLGVGATTMVADGEVGFVPELYGRYGLASNWDVGLKFVGIPPACLLQGDIKRLLVDGDFKLAADLGVSHAGGEVTVSSGDSESSSDWSFTALYPALIVGAGAFHGGVKGILIASGTSEDEFLTGSVFGVFAGSRLGRRVQLVPEVHLYFGDEPLFTAGLGIQLPLGGR